MSDDRDKYGIKTMEIGDEKFVAGSIPTQFYRYLATMRKRHPELQDRKFRVWDVFQGMRVRRIE